MQTSNKISRRTLLEVAGATTMAAALAGCFGVGGNQSQKSASDIEIWDIRTNADQDLAKSLTNDFNAKHKGDFQAKLSFFQNDPYKDKLQIAMGAGNPPDIFFGWGGGILKSYVDANDVYDLTADLNADADWKNRYLPSVLTSVTFDDKIYGIPINNTQPILFFYNKELFDQSGLSVPKTWKDLLNAVDTLKKKNVIPIAVAGNSKWTYLMYAEYLADRFGGPSAFNSVMAKQKDAWSQDAFIKASAAIQQLVDAGAFGNSFSSVTADTNQDTALLYTGKAAMMLQGTWNFPVIQTNSPDFIKQGKLGWFGFPTVEGGKGDPGNLVGGTCNYYSISKASKNPKNCITYLKEVALNDTNIKKMIELGEVPVAQGIADQLASAPNSDWLTYVYQSVQNAPNFQLSWDQALDPTPAKVLLTNLDQLFLKQITPEQFSENMNKTLTA